jgi:DNA polymerase elongation subunit (family B)
MEDLSCRTDFPSGLFHPSARMAKLVFDIETTALPLDNFDVAQQEFLFREAERLVDQAERTAKRGEIQQLFSLWPLTARIFCIAMLNADTSRGQVLFTADDYEGQKVPDASVEFVPCVDEAELLTAFWEVARHYESVITFNGRGFDVPFIYMRSALLNVPISRRDWLGYRYQVEPHCDLADQFTFYGSGGREGATRRFNLDFYCKAFGIASPKSHGITGYDVTRLVAEGRYREIAEYCLRDVQATVLLYHVWRERLSGIK